MKPSRVVTGAALLLCAAQAQATVCENQNGVPDDIFYDLSNTFTLQNNEVGRVVTLGDKSGVVGVNAICPTGTTQTTTRRSYVTDLPIREVIDRYQFLTINEYLAGAMSITDSATGIFYPPVNYWPMGAHINIPRNQPFPVEDSKLLFRLKVLKRFINSVSITRQVMFRVYVTTTASDPLTAVVYTISYSGEINVPQSCELNLGQIIEFDFDNIGASLFRDAGAGNRPQGIAPQTKTIAIKCTNVDSQAALTLRLEAEKASGDIMVSDNSDLGFKVAQSNGTPLTPNNVASHIPFRLDDVAIARIPIQAWPVSVTGNKPSEGPFTALGYLRVDYD